MCPIKPFVFQPIDPKIRKSESKPAGTTDEDPLVLPVFSAKQDEDRAKRIVILDDNNNFTDALGMLLQDEGYAAYAINRTADFLPTVERVRPHLAIMDLHFPDGDGRTLAKRLAENPQTTQLPVVFLSGMIDHREQTVVQKAKTRHYFLAKTAKPGVWLEAIQKILYPSYDATTDMLR